MPLAVSMRNWCASMNQRSTFLTLANTEPMDATRRVQTGAFTTCASIGSNHRSSPPCRALYEADCQWDRCGTAESPDEVKSWTKQLCRLDRYRPPSRRYMSRGRRDHVSRSAF